MAVHDHQVEKSIVVIIKKMHAPAHIGPGETSQAGSLRPVFKWKSSSIKKQGVEFVIEICDHNIRPAIAGRVANVYTHAGLCIPIEIECDFCLQAGIRKGSV